MMPEEHKASKGVAGWMILEGCENKEEGKQRLSGVETEEPQKMTMVTYPRKSQVRRGKVVCEKRVFSVEKSTKNNNELLHGRKGTVPRGG